MHETNNQTAFTSLTQALLDEKRTDRRWRNIRFVCWFVLFAYITISIFKHIDESNLPTVPGSKYTALIRLDGMIAPGRDFSSETLLPVLQEAFADKNAVGVVIDINSPGGTPVQAAIIHDSIITLKKKYHKKVIVVGEDLLTSGAYYVAVAADKIYVNPNTLTGSVGVIMKGFGFVELMKKMGIERRVYIAGNDKDRLDPFLPQSPEDIKKIKQVMSEVHTNFTNAVIEGRKGKLRAPAESLFTGDFWSGQSALNLGLVDGLGNLTDVMQKEFHTTQYHEYGTSSGLFRLLNGQISSAMNAMLYLQ